MNQREIIEPQELLDEKGRLVAEGWARKPFWRYDRSRIAAPKFRVKEWDYYYIHSHDGRYCLTVTISDLGYLGLVAVAWVDLGRGVFSQTDEMLALPMGNLKLPPGSETGDIAFLGKKIRLWISVEPGKRRLKLEAPEFKAFGELGLRAAIELSDNPGHDSMNIATSWAEKRTAFYYNRKINCMPASGTAFLGEKEFHFSPGEAAAGLDWGRGVWTYKNRWYWGSASGYLDGHPFGWNIGYGFSDRSSASENMIFYDGAAHKLEEVAFHIDEKDYLAPWRFTSSDGRFEMDFEPAVDRSGATDLKVIKSIQHQVFGYFSGRVVLDGGRTLEVKKFQGFAEDVLNWW
jgi:hypothetical protein